MKAMTPRRMVRTAAALTTAALAVTVAGCSTGGDDSSSADGKTTIVWDMWSGSEADLANLQEHVRIAEEDNPDITVALRTAPWGDYFTKLTTNLASGEVACITGMSGQYTPGYAEALTPLTDADLETAGIDPSAFSEGALDILSYDGELLGLPFDVAAMQVYYNADIFEEAGVEPPAVGWTLEDFEEAANAVSAVKPAFAAAMGDFQWMSLPIAASKKQPVDESGALALTDPDFVDAATWYAQFAIDGIASPPPSASSSGWGEEEFKAGNVAMAVDGTWNAVSYLNNETGFTAGMVDLPQSPDGRLGVVLGSGYGIGANCEHKEEALRVLGSLVGEKAQDYIASSGRSYPALAASQPLFFESIDEEFRSEVESVFAASFQQVEGARSTADWSQVYASLQPNLVSVFTGQVPMAEALETTQAQFGE
ncbi:sugar ABC transporter substrate-binding protein [Microbacterium nanhaiense]|uniref:Sugar ABC transporter substrate-binding protein n=1 Tax=Microbacterium nanhaiense TaxID=1301026 RepID=A0ABQ2N5B8_9MICO|nr:extracellular solute-binding protein [Microbacterium nanhaiense]GGO67131.1 sugar ABC transporter substrate-binding protein [Microbacterium nanhaiense]